MRAALLALALAACAPRPPLLDVRVTVRPDGHADADWKRALAVRGWGDGGEVRPLAPGETAWLERLRAMLPAWRRGLPALHVPFAGVPLLPRVVLLVGNQQSEDAFVVDDQTIGLGLHRWVEVYGPPDGGADDRLRRLLAHEYTHLVARAWAKKRPPIPDSPLDRALDTIFHEGLGHLRSLSDRWVAPDGTLTAHARATLVELEPIFVDRINAFAAGPSPEEEDRLAENMVMGRFDRKWGALVVALWLADERRGDDRRLRRWVEAGHRGVLDLARAHLPPHLAARLSPPP